MPEGLALAVTGQGIYRFDSVQAAIDHPKVSFADPIYTDWTPLDATLLARLVPGFDVLLPDPIGRLSALAVDPPVVPEGRKRRPFEYDPYGEEELDDEDGVPRRRGRPPRAVDPDAPKRPRGRPRKIVDPDAPLPEKRPRGRPPKPVDPNAPVLEKRSRGRPRKYFKTGPWVPINDGA